MSAIEQVAARGGFGGEAPSASLARGNAMGTALIDQHLRNQDQILNFGKAAASAANAHANTQLRAQQQAFSQGMQTRQQDFREGQQAFDNNMDVYRQSYRESQDGFANQMRSRDMRMRELNGEVDRNYRRVQTSDRIQEMEAKNLKLRQADILNEMMTTGIQDQNAYLDSLENGFKPTKPASPSLQSNMSSLFDQRARNEIPNFNSFRAKNNVYSWDHDYEGNKDQVFVVVGKKGTEDESRALAQGIVDKYGGRLGGDGGIIYREKNGRGLQNVNHVEMPHSVVSAIRKDPAGIQEITFNALGSNPLNKVIAPHNAPGKRPLFNPGQGTNSPGGGNEYTTYQEVFGSIFNGSSSMKSPGLPQVGDYGQIVSNDGRINMPSFLNAVRDKFKGSKYDGVIPEDGEKFGITKGTPEEYARLVGGMLLAESSGKVAEMRGGKLMPFASTPKGEKSFGPLQFNIGEFGLNTWEEVNDPLRSVDAVMGVMDKYFDGRIAGYEPGRKNYDGFTGLSAYFGSLRNDSRYSVSGRLNAGEVPGMDVFQSSAKSQLEPLNDRTYTGGFSSTFKRMREMGFDDDYINAHLYKSTVAGLPEASQAVYNQGMANLRSRPGNQKAYNNMISADQVEQLQGFSGKYAPFYQGLFDRAANSGMPIPEDHFEAMMTPDSMSTPAQQRVLPQDVLRDWESMSAPQRQYYANNGYAVPQPAPVNGAPATTPEGAAVPMDQGQLMDNPDGSITYTPQMDEVPPVQPEPVQANAIPQATAAEADIELPTYNDPQPDQFRGPVENELQPGDPNYESELVDQYL